VIAVFGPFGCRDHRVAVTSVVQQRRAIVVALAERALRPGTVECLAIYPTYRLLALAKTQLEQPYPTRAVARLAPS
jgi:hypothetical protein